MVESNEGNRGIPEIEQFLLQLPSIINCKVIENDQKDVYKRQVLYHPLLSCRGGSGTPDHRPCHDQDGQPDTRPGPEDPTDGKKKRHPIGFPPKAGG